MMNKNIKHMAGSFALVACLLALNGASYSQEPADAAAVEREKRAVTFTMAFTAYYANWAPVWKKFHQKAPVYIEGDYSLPKGSFMYGPSVSVTINRWQIAGNFLYGEIEGTLLAYNYPYMLGGPPVIFPYRVSLKSKKYDCDLLVSYQINSLFKFFFGPKYQGYQYRKRTFELIISESQEDIEYNSGGMGAGIGCSLPITGDLYLLMNFSGIVLVGSQKGSEDNGDRTSVAYGGNEIVTLAYHIRPIHATIAVGGRLQYLYFHITPHRYYPSKHDIFYGINMSAAVSF
ncbi:MAG: hypothetical protein JXA07_01835 [Spirochaetes bacterium]|nr:hypothetical protein [Spirochaetota bacterium]